MTTESVPWPVTAVEHRGGTVLRISDADNTIADHGMAHLIGRGGVFSGFTAEMIADAQLIDGTVGWVIDGEVVADVAPGQHRRGVVPAELRPRAESGRPTTSAVTVPAGKFVHLFQVRPC